MKKGFTIVELVVIMTIIAVLASIGILSYLNSQKKVRDSKRVIEVKSIQTAVEMYNDVNKVLPGNTRIWYQSNHSTNWIGSDGLTKFETDLQPFLSPLPVDPLRKTSGELVYRYFACSTFTDIAFCNGPGTTGGQTGKSYKIDAGLEVDTDLMTNDGGFRTNRYEIGTNLKLMN